MKQIFYLTLIALICFSCNAKKKDFNNQQILERSIAKHDPFGVWESSKYKLHIQEPRISNPHRYSIVSLNNSTNEFELLRNRDTHIAKYTIDADGKPEVLLDGRKETDEDVVKKYRLNPNMNIRYKNFYKMMSGLPMSLNSKTIDSMGNVSVQHYNNTDCYKIEIVLKEELFSKHWKIYISKDNYEFKGMEMFFPNDSTKGERLYFDGSIKIGKMNIPRARHWHEYFGDEYSGSSIIVKIY